MTAPAIDHVTIAGRDLDVMGRALTAAGLPSEYGGAHSNGVTHMSILGFLDGSYVELISTLRPGEPSPLWPKHMTAAGSPCAWCVESGDLAAEVERLRGRGVPVRGPVPMSRERADGVRLAWDLAFLGSEDPGAVLPFLIQDHTSRDLRVASSEAIATTGLEGIAAVVIGCRKLEEGWERFRNAYDWPAQAPTARDEDRSLGIRLMRFPGKPVVLVEPMDRGRWLSDRLDAHGESPCALLLRTGNWGKSEGRLRFAGSSTWLGEPVRWLSIPDLPEVRVGVVK